MEEEENRKSGLKIILSILILFFLISLLLFYWFVPTKNFSFLSSNKESNFSLSGEKEMQFYSNMRFPDKKISYKIEECSLKRTSDMKEAFKFLENLTNLEFYSVPFNEEITISCRDKQDFIGGLWIAGEGGPTNITQAGEFNIITHGQILLLKDSECPRPNIAIHELLHALGFDHSDNKNNLMYNITDCDQKIGTEIINSINNLYSIDSFPDLIIENVSAQVNGKYLNTEIKIRNQGFKDADKFNLLIYADGDLIKTLEVEGIAIGYGRGISLSNILILKLSLNEIEFVLDSSFFEIDKKNNKVKLVVND